MSCYIGGNHVCYHTKRIRMKLYRYLQFYLCGFLRSYRNIFKSFSLRCNQAKVLQYSQIPIASSSAFIYSIFTTCIHQWNFRKKVNSASIVQCASHLRCIVKISDALQQLICWTKRRKSNQARQLRNMQIDMTAFRSGRELLLYFIDLSTDTYEHMWTCFSDAWFEAIVVVWWHLLLNHSLSHLQEYERWNAFGTTDAT